MGKETLDDAILDRGGLDPADWEPTRQLGHRMVDDLVDWWQSRRESVPWQPMPDGVLHRLSAPLPETPQTPHAIYEDYRRDVWPYTTGNTHPRFFSHVIGTGTALGAFADLLAAGTNCNLFGGHQAACHVERQVVSWFADLMGFPLTASGLLLSGGSMANVLALAVALRDRAGFDVRRLGLVRAPQPLRLYCSSETHNSIDKAVELLGLGSDSVRRLGVGEDFRVQPEALVAAIREDRAAGWHPFCVVGNAVTVGTGAVDPLDALADIAAREGLWLHIDGAIGAVAVLSPSLAPALRGLERADSVAFDLHKWLSIPYEAGCVLIRDGEKHRSAFANATAYLSVLEAGLSSGDVWPNQLGPELSRGFKALKVWMSLKEHGVEGYRRALEANVHQARHLGRLVEETPELELLAPVTANIVCYRFRAADLSEDDHNRLNRLIVEQLHVRGIAVPSHTLIRGRFAIRVAITNHRTRRCDLDALVSETAQLGLELMMPEAAGPSSSPSVASAA